MILFTAILLLFSVFLYKNFRSGLYNELDDLLKSNFTWISDSIKDTCIDCKKNINISNPTFENIVRIWIHEKANSIKFMNVIIIIRDKNGMLISSSQENTDEIAEKTSSFIKANLENYIIYENLSFPLESGYEREHEMNFRVLSAPVLENNKITYIIQIAKPLNPIYLSLTKLKMLLFILLPLTVILAGIVGFFLINITLQPITNMIDSIHKIEVNNLNQKVDVPNTKDEINKLAITFNEMLSRINKSFTTQQQFTQDISHELKTPLTILKGQMEIALKKIRTHEEYEETISSSLEEVNRMSKILDELLTLEKFETNQMKLDIKSISITYLLKDLCDSIDILAQQRNIKISIYNNENIIIQGDERQIRSLFLNLLDNAIKYNKENGKVYIHIKKLENSVEIKIEDTGIGIKEEDLSHIFDRFYRTDKSRSTSGFGLGLSIVNLITKAHSGKIEVKSILNKGTIFTIILPINFQIHSL
jgi:two-component system, OmpR family, sensor kinase